MTLRLPGDRTEQKQAYACGNTADGTVVGDVLGFIDQLDLVPQR